MQRMRLELSLRSLAFAIVLGSVLSVSAPASAKTSRKVSHAYENVWPTAVRFLRIDEGFDVLEKDMENGYLLFEMADEGKKFRGAVEVIRRKDSSNRDAVELILTIKERPSYMEHGILDRMLIKIRKELGMPKDAPEEVEEEDAPKDEPKADESTPPKVQGVG